MYENFILEKQQKILDTATKSGLDAAKSVSEKEVYKTAQALKKFIGKNC